MYSILNLLGVKLFELGVEFVELGVELFEFEAILLFRLLIFQLGPSPRYSTESWRKA